MAVFTEVGSLGATGSTSNNQASLALTIGAAAALGSLVVVVVADNNNATVDGADAIVSSMTDNSAGGPNTWTSAGSFCNSQAAAAAGAAVQIFYSVLTNALANGDTITATFANQGNSDASGMTARNFSFTAGGNLHRVTSTGTLADDGADPGSLNLTTINTEMLRIRGIAGEVGNDTSLTPTSGWVAWANGNSAVTGTTAEMCARAEHHISTGTGDASDPGWVNCDNASLYVAFYVPAGLGVAEGTGAASGAGVAFAASTAAAAGAGDASGTGIDRKSVV